MGDWCGRKMEVDFVVDDDDDDDDDVVVLNFPGKKNSTANVVFSDDDDDCDYNYDVFRTKKNGEADSENDYCYSSDDEFPMEIKERVEVKIDKKELEIKIEEEMMSFEAKEKARPKYYPPLFNSDIGEVDTSEAKSLELNGHILKKFFPGRYYRFLKFMYSCRQKCRLELFIHPGDPRCGGLVASEGETLTDVDRRAANLAIKKYNKVNQNVKLELRELKKSNVALWGGILFYLTFSAEDVNTGILGLYQAALLDTIEEKILGLFRDSCSGKILAILTITGAEEDLAALRRAHLGNKAVEGEI